MRLIDADELKSKKEYSEERHEYIVSVAAIDWVNAIETAPLVHGWWEQIPLNVTNDRYGMNKYNTRIKCTACGFVTSSDFIGFYHCPNCGAKMDKK